MSEKNNNYKKVTTEQLSVSDTILATLFLWVWVLPSTVFWQISVNNNIMLPNIPYIIWLLPGELWRLSPGIHIISVTASPVLYYLFYGKKKCLAVKTKTALITVTILISFVHIIWGLSVIKLFVI